MPLPTTLEAIKGILKCDPTEMTLIEPDYRGQRNVYKLETGLVEICKGAERIVYRFAHTQRQK